ncbi:MAG: helix-turn-helix transcriptional regulator [Armatimonadota bacterium]|nr:helix-turn-helix transcriptional regulator [Armatimonadota bacterium]
MLRAFSTRMRPEEIKARLILKGITQAEIARRLKVSRGAISQVISGRERNQRIRKAIARALGLKVSDIWPEDR